MKTEMKKFLGLAGLVALFAVGCASDDDKGAPPTVIIDRGQSAPVIIEKEKSQPAPVVIERDTSGKDVKVNVDVDKK
jgi:type IV pilus biogenesis protein CpaD/CtpE